MQTFLASAVFIVTYAGLALGRIPGLRIDRAGLALVGASLMVLSGWLSLEEAFKAIDLETLTLLLGMMIIVGHLRVCGFFRLVTRLALSHAHSPFVLLCMIVFATGILSAFLVNDAICLVMAPLVASITRKLGRNPIPYLLAVAMASNAGSVATITGNPQNMIVGVLSGIGYLDFAKALAPVAAAALVMTILCIRLSYKTEFARFATFADSAGPARIHRAQLLKTGFVAAAVMAAFFAGVSAAKAAIIGAAFLLLTRSVKPEKIYSEIDGSLLIMFAGLFVVVAGAEKLPFFQSLAFLGSYLQNAWILSGMTAAFSNLVSNVPAVLVLKPFLANIPDKQKAWEIVAMSSTFAGNLTLVGSLANLIVAEQAKRNGTEISFGTHLMVGLPLTLLTLFFGTWWLAGQAPIL